MRVLLAFVVLAAAIPVGVRAMPMLAGATSMATQEHCPNCPEHPGTGSIPDKMTACQVLACAGAVAMLPMPAVTPQRVPLQAAYSVGLPGRWTGAVPAPDPLPPRPAVLD